MLSKRQSELVVPGDFERGFLLASAEQPGSLARALDPAAAAAVHQANGVSTPTAEVARARRESKAARHSFFSEAVGQPVLNIASFDIGGHQTRFSIFKFLNPYLAY